MRSPHRRLLRCAAALAAPAVLAAGCGPGEPEEPAARLVVTPAEVVLPYPGAAVLTAAWTPSAPLDDPIVFVHLLDADGRVLRTFDHHFPGDWLPGAEVSYPLALWQSALGPPLPDGVYDLTVGVYTLDGDRPRLAVEGREVDEGEYAVARVEAPVPAGGPRLAFGDGWEPAVPDADRQTFGARWLGDGAALELAGVDGPLDLALSVRLPAPDEMAGYTLVLDPGAAEPAVEVSSPCAAEPLRVAGAGTHEVTVPLRPADGVAGCAVEFDPGFVYLDPRTLRRLSVDLRRVLWAPGTEPAPPAADAAP